MTNETSLATPEQEIKDVFKTAEENKVWMPGTEFSVEEIKERLAQAKSETSILLSEAQKQIEQIKAFQTHGT